MDGKIWLSRISGMEWWNGTLEWNTGMGNLNQISFTDAIQHNNYYYKVNTLPTHMSHYVYRFYALRISHVMRNQEIHL